MSITGSGRFQVPKVDLNIPFSQVSTEPTWRQEALTGEYPKPLWLREQMAPAHCSCCKAPM